MIAELNRYPGSLLAISFSTIVKHIKENLQWGTLYKLIFIRSEVAKKWSCFWRYAWFLILILFLNHQWPFIMDSLTYNSRKLKWVYFPGRCAAWGAPPFFIGCYNKVMRWDLWVTQKNPSSHWPEGFLLYYKFIDYLLSGSTPHCCWARRR